MRLPGDRLGGPYAEACVLGDIDLVTPLGRAGVTCVVSVEPGETARYSRYVTGTFDALDMWRQQDAMTDRLVTWAREQPDRPALYYQTDGALLAVSRCREQLSSEFRFVLPPHDLVEDTVDKARFAELATALGLPAPPARVLRWRGEPAPAYELHFPLVLKPLTRLGYPPLQADLGMRGKAVKADSPRDLATLWPSLQAAQVDVLAQELVYGLESAIESYHSYVDAGGETVAEFTGVKVRTLPPEFGHSTAVEISAAPDVLAAGRKATGRLGVRGVVKIDYKRDGDGRLWLLEVNPRFTLWHHLAAAAGLNIPAIVHADLTGRPRPVVRRPRIGARWCDVLEDRRAAAEVGMGFAPWLLSALRCEARSGANLDDPMPFLRGALWPTLLSRAGRLRRSRRAAAGDG